MIGINLNISAHLNSYDYLAMFHQQSLVSEFFICLFFFINTHKLKDIN